MNTEQLVMNLADKSWSRYRDLPIFSAGVWNGKFYFGSYDGKVYINDGYVDNVLISDPNSYTDIGFSYLSKSDNLGNGRQKQVQIVRPTFLSDGGAVSYTAVARYTYDFTEAGAPSSSATTSGSVWDGPDADDTWDTAVWGGDFGATQVPGGAAGMGVDVAIAIQGKSRSRTEYVGSDVMFTQGGLL